MSDITMIFGFLLILGLALPGLLITLWLLFPGAVERARLRVERTPWKTFGMGLAGLIGWAIPVIILSAVTLPLSKFLAVVTILIALTFATLGAAGMAAQMARRLARFSSPGLSEFAAFLRGAVALELAAAVPVLGWAIVVPIALIESMGAAIFSVLHWVPKPALRPAPAMAAESASELQSA